MKTKSHFFWLAIVFVACLVALWLPSRSVEANLRSSVLGRAVPMPTPIDTGSNAGKVQTAGGLTTVTFDVAPGTVRVYLPDDMRAGDTISGTVVAEPKGKTEEERKKALEVLRNLSVEIAPLSSAQTANDAVTEAARTVRIAVRSATDQLFTLFIDNFIEKHYVDYVAGLGKLRIRLKTQEDSTPGTVTIPLDKGWTVVPLERSTPTQPKAPSRPPSPGPTGAGGFQLPTLGQQGRPLPIPGSFDGNASNTTLRFIPAGVTPQGFVGRPLAESPRQFIAETPSNFTGPAEIVLKEGSVETKGVAHVVAVALSAEKLNLLRGERTTLTIEVTGLTGIQKDVPLQLDSKGVITMGGGNFQNLLIKPNEVQKDGRYTTTRAITGKQAGGFTVTATVIVSRFDMRLQDDAVPSRAILWNSFTGDYIFIDPKPPLPKPTGGTVQPGGTTQTGGTVQPGGSGSAPVTPPTTPTRFQLTGLGKPSTKGCIFTLTDNVPDRRVFARLDACTKTGDAGVQTTSPKAEFNITDKDTADNTVPSPSALLSPNSRPDASPRNAPQPPPPTASVLQDEGCTCCICEDIKVRGHQKITVKVSYDTTKQSTKTYSNFQRGMTNDFRDDASPTVSPPTASPASITEQTTQHLNQVNRKDRS